MGNVAHHLLMYNVMNESRKPSLENPSPGWNAFIQGVGRALAAERRSAGLSQQQVAERIGVEPETLSRMESGKISPTLQRLRQLAGVYGCSLEALVGRASDQTPDIAKRLAEQLDDLSDADRAFVAQQTEQLIGHIKASRQRNI